MASQRFNSRALRQLAERFLRTLVQDGVVAAADHAELATALVRQWMTYDGRASLFVGYRRLDVYVDLARPRQCSIARPGPDGWMKGACADWKIGPEHLPDLIRQLNRGQSAEVVNADGIPVRVWVNPRERSMGVECLVPQPPPPDRKRDLHKIAADMLEQHSGLPPRAQQWLVPSVVRQWQQHEGHACVW